MNHKPSIFNFTYSRAENENIIYNTFSKALMVLDENEFEQYSGNQYTSEEIKQQLIDNGILVDEEADEVAFLKYFHYKNKFVKDTLFLTIAPTLDCNFACPYCYENRRSGKMSPEIQDALIEYIRKSVDDGTRNLDISWYGGEPLLHLDVFKNLAKRIKELSVEKGCSLHAHMVTNGYLLNAEIIEFLDEVGISKIQITMDGLKEHHDVRRPLRNGMGTFEKIYENLGLFCESPIAVVIRMNVDNTNAGDFLELKHRILELNNPNITIYPSPVEDINKDKVNKVSSFMTTQEFESFAINSCVENGMESNDFSVLDDRCFFCTAEIENCYVVDELGDFYKCWDEVGRQEYKCFNLLDMENIQYHNITKFLTTDPFSEEKCRNCVFLPLCFGGCKFQRAQLNKSVCGFTNETLKKYIEITFFNEKEE
jgi:uncharacterized protein